jgi:hypothetical protein
MEDSGDNGKRRYLSDASTELLTRWLRDKSIDPEETLALVTLICDNPESNHIGTLPFDVFEARAGDLTINFSLDRTGKLINLIVRDRYTPDFLDPGIV